MSPVIEPVAATAATGTVADPVLATERLGLDIGGVRILDEVSLSVRRGEILAVLGPNGAGKSTLFDLLSGLRRPSRGRVLLDGVDVTRRSAVARARAGLARSFQVTSVFPSLTVADNVRVAAQAHLGGSLALWRRARDDDAAARRAARALDRVGIAEHAGVIAAELPHGHKRKLEVALAIAGEPTVLLLDEPTAGMAAADVTELAEVLRDINTDTATTIVLIEHRMDLVVSLAHRLAVMHHGSLLACDDPDTVMADPLVQSAYLGEAL